MKKEKKPKTKTVKQKKVKPQKIKQKKVKAPKYLPVKPVFGTAEDYYIYRLNPVETATGALLGGIVGFFFSMVFFRNVIFSLIVGLLLVVPGIRKYRDYLKDKRMKNLLYQFRDMMESLSASYSAGKNTQGAFLDACGDLIGIYGEKADIVKELNKAWHIANTGRKGPVLIDLPMNIQRGDVKNPVYEMSLENINLGDVNSEKLEMEELGQMDMRSEKIGSKESGAKIENSGIAETALFNVSADVKECAAAIRSALQEAKRPVIMLGHGVSDKAVREELFALARQWKIPVITSVLEMSALSWDDPLNFGCIGGAYGHRYANMIANAKSDLLICLGVSLCTRQIGTKVHEFAKGAKIIRADIDSYNLRRNIHENGTNELKFCVDAADVIYMLAGWTGNETGVSINRTGEAEIHSWNLAHLDFTEWLSVCTDIRSSLRAVDDAIPERYPNRMIADLSDLLADTSAVAIDVGQHMVWSYQSFHNQKNQKLLFSGGHGAMGYALPAAIGAHYATGKPVACICGDGAFQMNIQELEWVKRENLPITMIVMNNHALGMIRHLQRDYFEQVYADTAEGTGFSSCNFAEVARAYGLTSTCMEAEAVKDNAAGFFCSTIAPRLLEILLEPGTYAYPKTCLGEPIHNQQPYIPKEIYNRLMSL